MAEDIVEIPVQLDWTGVNPQKRESWPLSGQVFDVKIHTPGETSIGFRGKEYKTDADGIMRGVPVEAISEIESMTFWKDGGRTPFQLKFDILGENGESLRPQP